jgi:PTS system ascorbate-specific IIA component
MAGLLIIAHAPLASSLKAVAQHVYADSGAALEALDVPPDMTPEEIETRAQALLRQVRDPEALILADVFGATPANVAQRLADGAQVKVVTGVNVPMLWRSMCYAAEPLDALVARAVAGATQGVMQAATSRPQNQASKPFSDGQDERHDQQ